MPNFELHETLATDTVEAVRWPLCRVLLMNDCRYPWLILVPARANMRDMHDLDPGDQAVLMTEIDRASRALTGLHAPDKINVAALGNMVPQLHIHVVARFRTDDAWPSPIWGAHTTRPYEPVALDNALRSLRAALN
ncbi:MAG: HIT domain-containing protein [Alphaproteobacteria bacterium]|nr:HIT domain-containing protein [Alphaproteobacteria bacterium]